MHGALRNHGASVRCLRRHGRRRRGRQDHQIKVSVYAAGYGTGWISEACRVYSDNHPDVSFSIEANARMFDTIKTRLESNTCDSDIVLIANYNYTSLVARGVLEDLSDVYESVIPDTEGTKVKDVIPEIQYNYRIRNGKPYGMPWQDANPSGFIYNKKMFRDNGWTVPDTMEGFFALCDKIGEANLTYGNGQKVAPLVYGGGQQSGYTANMFNQWICEYYGYEYMNGTFLKYESPEIYSYTQEGRQKAFETMAKLLKGSTKNGSAIALAGSNSLTAQAAQREFIQGHAAMDICGNWFPTEMTAYLKGFPDFEFGYMPLPHVNADKKDKDGYDSSKVRYSLDGNILCVPASSEHKEIAKDFLVSMYTKESYQTFVKENNGVLRPMNVEIDASGLNDFAKASYDYFSAGKSSGQFIYECSLSPMSLNGYLATYISQNGNLPSNLINAASYEAAMAIAKSAAADDYPRALEMWDSANNKWKDSYVGVQ